MATVEWEFPEYEGEGGYYISTSGTGKHDYWIGEEEVEAFLNSNPEILAKLIEFSKSQTLTKR